MFRGHPPVLVALEAAALLGFLVCAAVFLQTRESDGQLVPLDPNALIAGPSFERWYGIFFQEHHVGFSVSRTSSTVDGGQLFEQRSSFRFAAAGQVQEVITAGAATVDAEGRLQRFDFFMAADPVRLSVEGAVQGNEIVMDVNQAGETSELRFPVSKPPQVGLSFERVLRAQELAPGLSFQVPYFDPVTLAEGQMDVKVVDVEIVPGTAEEAWWLQRNFSGVETRMLVTGSGEVLREESALGLQSVRMSREDAQDVPTTEGPVDLIAQSAVRVEGSIPSARQTTHLTLGLQGAAGERVPPFPPFQLRKDDVITIRQPATSELQAGTPLAVDLAENPDLEEWVTQTPTISSAHPEIVTKAEALTADAPDRLAAARAIAQFVDEYVEDVPVVGVPNGLDVLRRGQGDCNEHTALFVSLARAVKIPARIAAGVVYSDRVPGTAGLGAFYYHAWPEIQMAPDQPWIAIDPTFGQFPADATHVKLVEGDLDRQIEIMSYMGRLGFKVISSDTSPVVP